MEDPRAKKMDPDNQFNEEIKNEKICFNCNGFYCQLDRLYKERFIS